ncbi:hypothetical protein QBC32DRAFT_253112 [Pseudoneurospora amorphoporcata]|uniref:Uncharacterized protein n=1 Tax=Pseudoneurospora amorphoporcata TaxID=241081 RepID=A0AAN6P0E9_9PEZI|nr:hypothetical protein QBC32DRAFT_253112 [Pseudoneurospora amorphoporcata]
MVNPRRPRPTRDTISFPNPVVGKLMSAPTPALAKSIVTAYRFKNMSCTPRTFAEQRTPRWFGIIASSCPSGAPPQNVPLRSSSPEDIVPLPASSPTLGGTSYASTGSLESGATMMAQGIILSGRDNVPLLSSVPEDIPLPASSPTLGGTSYATSYASTGSGESGATIMAQGTILPGSNNNNMDEESESSTAVVDRSNDPRFRTPEAYLRFPIDEIVEGPKDSYFSHPWHNLMKESTDFPFFMFNAIRYPAKSLNKAAAEAFPWKHVETIRAPWVNDGKLLQYDEPLGYCVEKACDEDVSKLDKNKLFDFTHVLDAALQFHHEDVQRYAKYLKDIETEVGAIRKRAKELEREKSQMDEELSSLRHKLQRSRGPNVLVGTQRNLVQAKVEELNMYQDDISAALRELVQKYNQKMAEHHRTVIMTLHLESLNVSDLHRAEAKRKAEAKANEEEQRHLMNLFKSQRQKDVEEGEEFQRRLEKTRARAATPTTQADDDHLLGDEDLYNASPRGNQPLRPSAKDKGKGKAVDTNPNPPPFTFSVAQTSTTTTETSPNPFFAAAAAALAAGPSLYPTPDDLIEDIVPPQPQTLTEAGQLLNPHPLYPQDVPSWFPIFDAQQIVPLRAGRPRERFDELTVEFAELYSKAEEEKKKKKKKGVAGKKPLPKIYPEFHDPHPEWPTATKRERGGWWLCRPVEDPEATRPEKACKLCKAARAEAARARGVFPESEDGRTAQEQYNEINEAMDLAMAQAHVGEAKRLRERTRREDEEAERVRRWNGMSFEEKREMGFH